MATGLQAGRWVALQALTEGAAGLRRCWEDRLRCGVHPGASSPPMGWVKEDQGRGDFKGPTCGPELEINTNQERQLWLVLE